MGSRVLWVVSSFISGALLIALGVLFLAQPGSSLATVLLLTGLFTLAYGGVLVIGGLLGSRENRAATVTAGAIAAIFGIVVLVWPGLTALTLLYAIAAWVIVSGFVEIAAAIGDKRGGNRVWRGLSGALSLVVGAWFIASPGAGALALLWLIGVYLVAIGVLRILGGFMQPPQLERRQKVQSRARVA
jgi:uncharacterized membrane protein HdeD (DUF308 family)